MKRRNFISAIPALVVVDSLLEKKETYPISCNSYNWATFYTRKGKQWEADMEADIALFATSGITAYEPSIDSVEKAKKLIPILTKYNIAMPSIYMGSVLHDKAEVDKSINLILAVSDIVKNYGTKIIVTNPNPISWGGEVLKSDEQLMTQATALEKLGKALKSKGIKIAYHTHDMEMKGGAREFHHMMQNTSPNHVYFCMDTHWIYRGSANSQLPVFDVLKMYGDRIVELHLRQSVDHVWTETFTAEGDIDYNRFAKELAKRKIKPHIVIEQAIEKLSTNNLDPVAAHKINLQEIVNTFRGIM
jgi:inosose dehydratase